MPCARGMRSFRLTAAERRRCSRLSLNTKETTEIKRMFSRLVQKLRTESGEASLRHHDKSDPCDGGSRDRVCPPTCARFFVASNCQGVLDGRLRRTGFGLVGECANSCYSGATPHVPGAFSSASCGPSGPPVRILALHSSISTSINVVLSRCAGVGSE